MDSTGKGFFSQLRGEPLMHIYIDEKDIIKEVAYCFEGSVGNFIKFDPDNGYTMQPNVVVSKSFTSFHLLELGLQVTRIQRAVQPLTGSLTAQCLKAAVLGLVDEYRRAFSKWSDRDSEAAQVTPLMTAVGECETASKDFLLPWLVDASSVLRRLVSVLKVATSFHGGKTLDPFVDWAQHGNPKISYVFKRILDEASQALISIIRDCLCYGVLEDPKDECFIAENNGTCSWRNKFVLRRELMPDHMNSDAAQLILDIGSSAYVLKNNFKVEESSVDASKIRINILSGAAVDSRDLSRELVKLKKAKESEALRALKDELKRTSFFEKLHGFVFLGNSEFGTALVQAISPFANRLCQNVSHAMLSESLIKAFIDKNRALDLYKSIGIDIVHQHELETVKDALLLHFRFTEPLKTYFGGLSNEYHKLFAFNWYKHIALNCLSESKKTLLRVDKEIHPKLKNTVRLLHLLLHRLYNLMHYVASYVAHYVLHEGWLQMADLVERSSTIQELVDGSSRIGFDPEKQFCFFSFFKQAEDLKAFLDEINFKAKDADSVNLINEQTQKFVLNSESATIQQVELLYETEDLSEGLRQLSENVRAFYGQ